MSTRAQIAIQTGPDEWAPLYVRFDGYPAHMLTALARWKPEDILSARDIRQVTPEVLNCFSPPLDPRILLRPTQEFAHLLHVGRLPVSERGAEGRCGQSAIRKH